MLPYPNIDPVAIHITDSLQVRWYGIMYLLAFAVFWFLMRVRTKERPPWTADALSDLIFYAALGVLIGGRVGYVLFYDAPALIKDPLLFFKIWQGGMSFHGGLLGVVAAFWLFARKMRMSFISVCDVCAPMVPLGLGFGRIGNFINNELWGRVTDVPWAMIFPNAGPLPRHPSQLYAVGLEGLLLFCVLWIYSSRPRPPGYVSALFLFGYASVRIFEEFFREPDPQYGYLAFGWLTMGHLLCLPMIAAGLLFYRFSKGKEHS